MIVDKLKNRATTLGQEFEYKLAALLFVRLKQRPELRFELATNVAGADPCDDILLRLNWRDQDNALRRLTYLVQLKHGDTPREFKNNPFGEKEGKYSVCTYFKVYKKLAERLEDAVGISEENKKYLNLHHADEYRFIIYTNNAFKYITANSTASVIPNLDASKSSKPQNNFQLENHFPHCDLLTSAGDDGRYVFSENDTRVWNLFNTEASQEIYQKNFLPRLQILSREPNSSDLEELIANELKTVFKLSEAESKRIFRKYLDRAKRWWESDDGDVWTNETTVLEEILVEDISSNFREMMSLHPFSNFRFSTESCKDLAKEIRCQCVSIVATPGVKSEIRCLKILQVLDLEFRVRILILDEKSFVEKRHLVEIILERKSDDWFILINLRTINSEVLSYIREICQNARGNVVISCSSAEDIASVIAGDVFRIEDRWSLDQLDSLGQNEALKQRVNFQGRHVSLRELEAAWPTLRQDVDGPFLCALAEGSAVLGDTLAPLSATGESDPLYVQRVVEHRWEMKREVLFLNSGRDMFVLSGFPESALRELVSVEKARKLIHRNWHVLPNEGKAPNTEKDYEKLRKLCEKFPQKSIHHIAYSKTYFIWLSSRGSNERIIPFLIQRSNVCNTKYPVCRHREYSTYFSLWEGRAFYLSGEPGAGKSTFLAHLAKSVPIVNWCVFIPLSRLNEFFWSICEEKTDVDVSQAIRLVVKVVKAESCSSFNTTEKFINQCLMHTGNLSIFVDGVDEICPRYKQVALSLLNVLMELKNYELWVSSRNHLDHHFKKLFKHEPLHLQPFSQDEQIDYICHCVSQQDSQVDAEELRRNVSETVEYAKQLIKGQGQEGFIFDVPLHTYLLAQSYREFSVIFHDQIQKPILLILKLYQKFISERVGIYMKKIGVSPGSPNFKSFQSQMTRMHEACALSVLGFDSFLQEHCIQTYVDDFKEDNTGILYFSETNPVFVHHSFAEYFCSSWMSNNLEKINEESWESMSILSRSFLNALLANHSALHEAVILGNTEQIQSEIGRILERDKGGRTALHLASIKGNVEVCCLLLRDIDDIDDEDKVLNWSALQYADNARHLAVVDVLLRFGGKKDHARKTMEDNVTSKGRVFRIAAEEGYLDIIKFFVDIRNYSTLCEEQMMYYQNDGAADTDGRTPLHIAAARGHKDIVEFLIKNDASVNKADITGLTPLHSATEYSNDGVIQIYLTEETLATASQEEKYTERGHKDIVQLLLAESALVNAVNENGQSPLHFACWERNQRIVELLLARDALVDVVNIAGKSPLHYACWKGHQGIVELLLAKGAPVNAVDNFEYSPLHSACIEGHVEIVQLLLAKGALIDAATNSGDSPLHCACVEGNENIVKLLLSNGASVDVFDKEGKTPLCYAIRGEHQGIMEHLLAKGASVNAVDKEGKSLLHYASCKGNQSIVEQLLAKGASVGAVDEEGRSPLHYACYEQHQGIVDTLLGSGALVNAVDKNGCFAIHCACTTGDVDILKILLAKDVAVNVVDKHGNSALHYACKNGHQDIVQLLLAKGVTVNAVNSKGECPLHYACWRDDKDILDIFVDFVNELWNCAVPYTCEKGRLGIIERLLAKGASINAITEEANSPIHYACWKGLRDIVEILLAKGALVSIVNENGYSPLHYACSNGHQGIVECLLVEGASVSESDKNRNSPLHYACSNGKLGIVQRLLAKGASVNALNKQNDSPLFYACNKGHQSTVELLLANGASVNGLNNEGKSPLHYACGRGYHGIVELFLDKGALVNSVDENGSSPLHCACIEGHENIVELLIAKEAVVNSFDKNGNYPLHYACKNEHKSIVELLVACGVSVDVLNAEGKSPLHYACGRGYHGIVELLLTAGAFVDTVDENGSAPLHCACREGHEKIVEVLLTKDTLVDAVDKHGNYPLHYACKNEHQGIVALLLANGASVDLLNAEGKSPLHYACWKGCQGIIELLLATNALVDSVDRNGRSPLHCACIRGHGNIVDLLLARNPLVDAVDKNGNSPLLYACKEEHPRIAEQLLAKGALADSFNTSGQSPLHFACWWGLHGVVEILLARGASVRTVDKDGLSPLYYACGDGHQSIVECLLAEGASVNESDKEGNSPLHMACSNGNLGIVERLLAEGALVNVFNEQSKSPLYYARKKSHQSIVEVLLANGASVDVLNMEVKSPLHHVL